MDVQLEGSVDDITERVRAELEAEGFGVLTEIDVRRTLKEKLDEEFVDYRILGACNPPIAHEALESERRLGALLPCNVVVYETESDAVGVSAVDPGTLLSVVDNPEMEPIGAEIRARLQRVLDSLEAA